MKVYKINYLLFIFSTILLFSCSRNKKNIGFYDAQPTLELDSLQQNYLQSAKIDQLYVRFFNIDLGASGVQVSSDTKIGTDPLKWKDIHIIPVVKIADRIFQELDTAQVRKTAVDLEQQFLLLKKQLPENTFSTLFFECDWTPDSRDKYFYFLSALKETPTFQQITFNTLIFGRQLHHFSNYGIPPTEKVTFGAFEMGNLTRFGSQNSLLNMTDLKKNTQNILSNYPKTLSLALPFFSRMVVFRNQQFIGISDRITYVQLQSEDQFIKNPNTNLYLTKQDLPNLGLLKGDVVRYEKTDSALLLEALKYLKSNLKKPAEEVVLYELNDQVIESYTIEDLKKLMNAL